MRDDLNASEKRLIAALDRIDQFLDRKAAPAADTSGLEAELQDSRAENQRLSQELVRLHENQAEVLNDAEARLTEAHDRLLSIGQEAARLAAANEALAESNRALIERSGAPAEDARRALEAEIESLRAARTAEIAQMGDIIEALDRMIGTPEPDEVAPPRKGSARAAAATGAAPAAAAPRIDPRSEPTTEPAAETAAVVMLETPPMPVRPDAEAGASAQDTTPTPGDDEERG